MVRHNDRTQARLPDEQGDVNVEVAANVGCSDWLGCVSSHYTQSEWDRLDESGKLMIYECAQSTARLMSRIKLRDIFAEDVIRMGDQEFRRSNPEKTDSCGPQA